MFGKMKKNNPQRGKEERCIPVAKKFLELIGAYQNHKLGQVEQKEFNKAYKELVQEMKAEMLDKDIKLSDINYILKLVSQPIEAVQYIMTDNFNNLLRTFEKGYWGKDRDDVTIKELDAKLKEFEVK